jgi:hypothetical protein
MTETLRPQVRQSIRIPILITLVLSSTLALAGCGGNKGSEGPKESLKGKVTLNGQPVSGMVIFVGSDKKEISTAIAANGEYMIPNPPKGEGYFLVKGMGGSGDAPKGDLKGAKLDVPQASGAAPPAKYSKPNNGLTANFSGGHQEHNLELSQ